MPKDGKSNKTNNLERAEAIAERLREETYIMFKNDCLTKSIRFKRQCQAEGIAAHAVACIGLAKAQLFGRWLIIPVIHGRVKLRARGLKPPGHLAPLEYGVSFP